MLRKAARKGVACQIVRVAQMIGARQAGAEGAAIADDATDADLAETDAMIAALAPDQSGARALPPRPLDGERDLERGIDRFGAAVREEDAVESLGHQRRRSEEHTSELQSLMRISYAVFCLKKKKATNTRHTDKNNHNKHINPQERKSTHTND